MNQLSTHFKIPQKGTSLTSSVVTGKNYRFTVLTPQLIRMEFHESGIFLDKASQTVINRAFPEVSFRLIETEKSLEIITESLHLHYMKGEFTANSLYIDLKGKFNLYGSRWHYGASSGNLGGTARTLDYTSGEIPLEDGVLSQDGFAVLDDSKSQVILEDGWVEPREKGVIDLYFFGYGREYFQCMKDFFQLTGPTPLLPRYALGNWWSRYWKYSQEEYEQLMLRFQEEDIPFSVAVIDMDWHLTEVDEKYGTGWTGYSWNKELFPNPQEFLHWLHQHNLKTTLNLHPASGVRGFEDMYEEMAIALGIDPKTEDTIPFDITNQAFLEAYFQYLHHPQEKIGVDFWWIDWQQGTTTAVEGLDPLWMLNHYHFLDKNRENDRSLIFSRYAGAGSHRYPVGFSGDTIISWDSYAFQPYFTATASNIGYCWWSHDIGGHMMGERDEELSTRWVQYAVFSPILRLHSSNSLFTGKEPWNFSLIHEKHMKEALVLRQQLVPYLYTLNYRLHKELLPFLVPLYYHHPHNHEAYEMKHQYYFGENLMVSPILTPISAELQVASTETWFPDGIWYDFFSGKRYTGGRSLKCFRGIASQPVFAKAGTILPLARHKMGDNSVEIPDSLDILLFPEGNGEFTLIEDDGSISPSDENIAQTTFQVVWGEHLNITILPTIDPSGISAKTRNIRLFLRGFSEKALDMLQSSEKILETSYDHSSHTCIVSYDNVDMSKMLTLSLPTENALVGSEQFPHDLEVFLRNAQISFVLKDKIYNLLTNTNDKGKMISDLRHFQVSEDLFDALLELISL